MRDGLAHCAALPGHGLAWPLHPGFDAERQKGFPVDTVAPAVSGMPRVLLRIEGGCIFAAAVA